MSNLPTRLEIRKILHTQRNCKLHTYLKEDLLALLSTLLSLFDFSDVAFICIASPGINDENHGVVKLAFNAPLTNVNIASELYSRKIPRTIPIILTGDVGCAGVGELISGAGQQLSNIFVLGIGTGLNLCYVEKEEPGVDTMACKSNDKRLLECLTPLPQVPSCFFSDRLPMTRCIRQ